MRKILAFGLAVALATPATAQLKQYQDFVQSGAKGRFKVLRAFKDWEKDVKFHQGETITVTGLETQGFRRLLRWAEAEGRIELVA